MFLKCSWNVLGPAGRTCSWTAPKMFLNCLCLLLLLSSNFPQNVLELLGGLFLKCSWIFLKCSWNVLGLLFSMSSAWQSPGIPRTKKIKNIQFLINQFQVFYGQALGGRTVWGSSRMAEIFQQMQSPRFLLFPPCRLEIQLVLKSSNLHAPKPQVAPNYG